MDTRIAAIPTTDIHIADILIILDISMAGLHSLALFSSWASIIGTTTIFMMDSMTVAKVCARALVRA